MSGIEVVQRHGNASLTHLSQWRSQIKDHTNFEQSLASIEAVVLTNSGRAANEVAEREEEDK